MSDKKYRINEIFYSLQGEGRWAGRAAIFIRFSGCNLKCPFCDTDFSQSALMTMEEIMQNIENWKECKFIVLTGGEPTLQTDENFVNMLHEAGYYVAIETNGTKAVPKNIDWVTVSPKEAYVVNGKVCITKADEVKIVFDGVHQPSDFGIQASNYYVQPCDTGRRAKNKAIVGLCVDWVKQFPKWKLSLQQQKIIKVR